MGELKAVVSRLGTLTPSDEQYFGNFFTLDSLEKINIYFKVLHSKSPRIRCLALLNYFPMRFGASDQIKYFLLTADWPRWILPLFHLPKKWKNDTQEISLTDSDWEYIFSFLVTLITTILNEGMKEFGKDLFFGETKKIDKEPSTPHSGGSFTFPTTAVPNTMKDFLQNLLLIAAENTGWTEEVLGFSRLILWGFVKTIISQWVKKGQPPMLSTPYQWVNLLDVLSVLKEFIFFRPVLDVGVVGGKDKLMKLIAKERLLGLHLDERGCLDLPLVGKVVELLAGLIRKLEGQILESSPKQSKEIVLQLADEAKFFILVYQAFNPIRSKEGEDAFVWNNTEDTLDGLMTLVKKKKYPYPTAEEILIVFGSITQGVEKQKYKHKMQKFYQFASEIYFQSSYEEMQKSSTVQALPTPHSRASISISDLDHSHSSSTSHHHHSHQPSISISSNSSSASNSPSITPTTSPGGTPSGSPMKQPPTAMFSVTTSSQSQPLSRGRSVSVQTVSSSSKSETTPTSSLSSGSPSISSLSSPSPSGVSRLPPPLPLLSVPEEKDDDRRSRIKGKLNRNKSIKIEENNFSNFMSAYLMAANSLSNLAEGNVVDRRPSSTTATSPLALGPRPSKPPPLPSSMASPQPTPHSSVASPSPRLSAMSKP